MRSLVGFAVLGTGLVAGWYYAHPQIGGPVEDAYRAARASVQSAKPLAASEPAVAVKGGNVTASTAASATYHPAQPRSFSPSSPLFAEASSGKSPIVTGSLGAAGATAVAVAPATPDAWPAVVDPVAPRATLATAPSAAPGEEARREMVRAIQRELKRVGCFNAEPTGWWGAATTHAMADFVGKSNASLPVDKPDVAHLALLKSAAPNICGSGCGAGQVAQNGVCVSKTITARASGGGKQTAGKSGPGDKTTPAEWPVATVAAAGSPVAVQPVAGQTSGPRKEPLPGAMAVGGPRVEDAPGQTDDVSPSLTNPQQPTNETPTAAQAPNRPLALPLPRTAGEARKPARADQPRPARHARSGTRTVQDIFQHPLGR